MAYPPLANPRPDVAAQFRRNVLTAGGMVAGPDGETITAPRGYPTRPAQVGGVHLPPPARPPLPRVIELEDEPERIVAITRRNGDRVELHVSLNFAALRGMETLQEEVLRLNAAARTADDQASRNAIGAQQIAAAGKLLALVFEDLPDGLMETLEPRMLRRLMDTAASIVQEAIGAEADDGPNVAAGR